MRYPSSPPSTFLYLNEPLEEVPCYKYLGFYISNSGKLDKGMEMLVASANKAYSALLGHSKRFGGLPVSISCYLFTVLVEPIMLYASEIWGMHSTETMERLVLSFCKHILCVPTTCSTTAVQGDRAGENALPSNSSLSCCKILNALRLAILSVH